jgi:hypothetical protein
MAEKVKVIRKRDSFYTPEGKLIQKFPSISQAKRHSRLQQGAGNWEVSVDRSADPKPPRSHKRMDAADKFIADALRKEQAEKVRQEQERKRGPNTLGLRKQA